MLQSCSKSRQDSRGINPVLIAAIFFLGALSAATSSRADVKTLHLIHHQHLPRDHPGRNCIPTEIVVDDVMSEQALATQHGKLIDLPSGEYEGTARSVTEDIILLDITFPIRTTLRVKITADKNGLAASKIGQEFEQTMTRTDPDFDIVMFFRLDSRKCNPSSSSIKTLSTGRRNRSILFKNLFQASLSDVPFRLIVERANVLRLESSDNGRFIEKRGGRWFEYRNHAVAAEYDEISQTTKAFELRDRVDATVEVFGKKVRVPRLVKVPHGFKAGSGTPRANDGAFRQWRPTDQVYFAVERRIETEAPCTPPTPFFAPTNLPENLIRDGYGRFRAPRGTSLHSGVDIIPRATFAEREPYTVKAVADGIVAYSRLNGSATTGFGNVIVIDHGNGCYSFYGHLANSPFTPMEHGGNLLKQVGDQVSGGEPIGYFVDIKADVASTGNARTTVPIARHQIHFELIKAPAGRRGTGSLSQSVLAPGAVRVDPEPFLLRLGYSIE